MPRQNRASRQDSVEVKNPRKHFRKIFNKVSLLFSVLIYLSICLVLFFNEQYDKDKDGHISVKELDDLIQSQEYEHDIPEHVVEKIHSLADHDGDGKLNFNEFVAMINHPALRPIFGSLVNRL